MNALGKNATAKPYQTGGGSGEGSSGVGRRPSGYVGDKGTPTYNSSGALQIVVEPYALGVYQENCKFVNSDNGSLKIYYKGASGSGLDYRNGYWTGAVYRFVAPVTGLYYIGNNCSLYNFGSLEIFFENEKKWATYNFEFTPTDKYSCSVSLKAGQEFNLVYSLLKRSGPFGNKSYKYKLNSIPIFVEPIEDSNITTTNNITINNNTWNGNIYTDNSTNLTYIYPQYTTINENNETVTNISNNPIIYNNETKQYYTYDTVTNNYYYITYEAPTPSPSPDPDPTPTPEPGGDTGDTSGIMKILQEIKAVLVSGFAGITEKLQNIGVGGSTPETAKPGSSSGNKGQSWWEKLLGKIGDAIVDGLLGAISAVLKLIFKLFTTILGWIIWLVSQVLTLFPFLPPGLGALLIGGVVVCFIIGLIKFIRG